MDEFTADYLPKKVLRYLEAYFADMGPTQSDSPGRVRGPISQLESDIGFAARKYDGHFEHVPAADLAYELRELANARGREARNPLLVRSVIELRAIAEGLYQLATLPRKSRTTRF